MLDNLQIVQTQDLQKLSDIFQYKEPEHKDGKEGEHQKVKGGFLQQQQTRPRFLHQHTRGTISLNFLEIWKVC